MQNKDKPVRERVVEKHFCAEVKKEGWKVKKLFPGDEAGWTDRVVAAEYGLVYWVELKRDGEGPSPIQKIRHRELRSLGHEVWILDSREQIRQFILKVKKDIAYYEI